MQRLLWLNWVDIYILLVRIYMGYNAKRNLDSINLLASGVRISFILFFYLFIGRPIATVYSITGMSTLSAVARYR